MPAVDVFALCKQTVTAGNLTRNSSVERLKDARPQLVCELISGVRALFLALFMWGHVLPVGWILLGTRGFD